MRPCQLILCDSGAKATESAFGAPPPADLEVVVDHHDAAVGHIDALRQHVGRDQRLMKQEENGMAWG